jgi:peptide/nickel transport system substrate-binding protein
MFTKQRSLFFLTPLIMLSLILSACGSTTASPTATQAPARTEAPASTQPPQPTEAAPTATSAPLNKDITIVIPEDPPSFNAVIAYTGYDAMVMKMVLLGMTRIDPDGKIYPELAAELPSLDNGKVVQDTSAGTMSVTWKMRSDIQWEDGKPVTADDVIFTYKAITDPNTGSWIPGIDSVDSVEKIDDYSFKVNYNAITPSYLTLFGGEQVAIWPAHYCDASQGFSAWDCGLKPLSDGPFVMKEWVKGDHLTFTKNDKYYQAGKPDIEQVTVKIIPDATVRKQMMINGDADINMWTNESVTADLQKEANVKVSVSPNDRFVMRLFMNEAAKGETDATKHPHPILSDPNVRQAIREAIDVDTISQQIFSGFSKPVWTEFFRPPYNQCTITRPKFDAEAAKALLDQAGWTDTDGDGIRECHGCKTGAKDGYKMEMEFITYKEYGEPILLTQQLIAEELGAIGIKLNLTTVEGSVLWADSQSGGIEMTGNFDIDLWDDGYAGTDPGDFVVQYYSKDSIAPDQGWNIARWDNQKFNDLLSDSYTLDNTQRQNDFCQMAQIMDQEVPMILLFTTIDADAYSTRLDGVQSTVNDVVTWNIADWKVVK